jgi:uncharacterized protein YndB with AHSA1/START domain
MWKWLGGCLLVALALIVAAFWWGYNSMQSSIEPDGSTTVKIGAPPSRVFASLADGDSVATWMAQGNTVRTSRRGPLIAGDIVRIEMGTPGGIANQSASWVVAEVIPDRVVVFHLLPDSTQGVAAIRRGSLSEEGDSTRVTSRIVSPLIDQLASDDEGRPKGGVYGFTSKIMLSMLRMQSRMELLQLKARIEGTARAMPAATRTP